MALSASGNELSATMEALFLANPDKDRRRVADYDAIHATACLQLQAKNAHRATLTLAGRGKTELPINHDKDALPHFAQISQSDYGQLVGRNPTEKALSLLADRVPRFCYLGFDERCEQAAKLAGKWRSMGLFEDSNAAGGK